MGDGDYASYWAASKFRQQLVIEVQFTWQTRVGNFVSVTGTKMYRHVDEIDAPKLTTKLSELQVKS